MLTFILFSATKLRGGGEEEGEEGMNVIFRLVFKAFSAYGWFIIVTLLWEEVELKIWGSNDEFDVDNRGSRGNSAGRDSNIDHWSLIELEQTNNGDSIYQGGGGGNMTWYIVAGIAAMVVLVCLCKKAGMWKALCFLTEERATSRRRRREEEDEEREGRRALREVELKRMIQAATGAPPPPPPPPPPPQWFWPFVGGRGGAQYPPAKTNARLIPKHPGPIL